MVYLLDRFWLNVDLVFLGLDSPICSPFVDCSPPFVNYARLFFTLSHNLLVYAY